MNAREETVNKFTLARELFSTFYYRAWHYFPDCYEARKTSDTAIQLIQKIQDLQSKTKSTINVLDLRYEENEETSLMCVAKLGYSSVVKELIKAGVNLEVKNKEGKTALFLAVERTSYETAEILLTAGASLLLNGSLNKALMEGACSASPWLIEKTIKHGADVNYIEEGYTPLTSLFYVFRNTENLQNCVRLLLQNKANPFIADPEGNTAVYLSLDRYISKEVAITLIQVSGTEEIINRPGKMGETFLFKAAARCISPTIIAQLFYRGAMSSLNLKTKFGETALDSVVDYAVRCSKPQSIHMLLETIHLLLEKKADIGKNVKSLYSFIMSSHQMNHEVLLSLQELYRQQTVIREMKDESHPRLRDSELSALGDYLVKLAVVIEHYSAKYRISTAELPTYWLESSIPWLALIKEYDTPLDRFTFRNPITSSQINISCNGILPEIKEEKKLELAVVKTEEKKIDLPSIKAIQVLLKKVPLVAAENKTASLYSLEQKQEGSKPITLTSRKNNKTCCDKPMSFFSCCCRKKPNSYEKARGRCCSNR